MSAFFHTKLGLNVFPRVNTKQPAFGDTLQDLTPSYSGIFEGA